MAKRSLEWQSTDLTSLGQELQNKLAKLDEAFHAKLKSSQDPVATKQLQDRRRQLLDEINRGYQTRLNELKEAAKNSANGVSLYDRSLAGIDMDLLVYDGDRDTLRELMLDSSFSTTVNQLLAELKPYNSRKELLTRALKLTPSMAPQIYKILEHCSAALKLNKEIEMYVYQDTRFNACCYPPVKDKVLLMMTSALLEKFSEPELTFVIGHELGHYLFEHTRFPIDYILQNGANHLSPLHAMKLYSWIRSAEVTADRVGLVCCRNFETVGQAFFKLSSGISTTTLEFCLAEYIDQVHELQTELENSETTPEDWYSTHPFSPIRIKALQIFNKSQTYHELIGQPGGEVSEEDMERSVRDLMSMMEPTYMQGDTDQAQKTQRAILSGGYLLAAANGVVEASEVQALAALLGPKFPSTEIRATAEKPLEAVRDEFLDVAKDINHILSPTQKLQIIENLSVISYADGHVDQYELKMLYWICENLYIDPGFVDHVLSQARRGVD